MTRSEIGLPEPPWIVGHRGAAGEAPENTLDSLMLAVDQGADMVEVDLQLTADGRLVACHDWTLERMGRASMTVEDADYGALAQIEVSGEFRDPARPRRMATLIEILETLPASLPLNLELKRRRAQPERIVDRLADIVAARKHLLISSFDWPLLDRVRQALPHAALAPLGGRRTDPRQLLAAAAELGAWSVHCRFSLAESELVAAADADGRPTIVYTVNERDVALPLLELGVSGVFSDFPGRLRRQLEEGA